MNSDVSGQSEPVGPSAGEVLGHGVGVGLGLILASTLAELGSLNGFELMFWLPSVRRDLLLALALVWVSWKRRSAVRTALIAFAGSELVIQGGFALDLGAWVGSATLPIPAPRSISTSQAVDGWLRYLAWPALHLVALAVALGLCLASRVRGRWFEGAALLAPGALASLVLLSGSPAHAIGHLLLGWGGLAVGVRGARALRSRFADGAARGDAPG